MYQKTILLTLFLITGVTFQQCNPFDCNCPPYLGDYFDIRDIALTQYRKRDACCINALEANEEVRYSDYYGITIDFQVDYLAFQCREGSRYGFSLTNTALACSCPENGWLGSKTEKLESLAVLTLHDFDASHSARDTLNDLLEVRLFTETMELEEYLRQDTSLVRFEDLSLQLKKAPELDTTFQVYVRLELSTGEVYEAQSVPVRLIP